MRKGDALRWRILRDPPAPAGWNMAMDVSLAHSLPPEEGVLRIYRWRRPTLSFGRNQRARGVYDPFALDHLGAEVVRRPTGGREVLHDRELTYSVVLPAAYLGGPRESYRRLNEALAVALRSLGVPTELAPGAGPARTPDAGPCFREPASGEVIVEGRKLVGSAQARFGRALLQHGSLLLAPPSLPLDTLRCHPPDGADPAGGVTLSELLAGPVAFARVAAAIEAAMAGAVGGRWERGEATVEERQVAEGLLTRYESPGWTWRL